MALFTRAPRRRLRLTGEGWGCLFKVFGIFFVIGLVGLGLERVWETGVNPAIVVVIIAAFAVGIVLVRRHLAQQRQVEEQAQLVAANQARMQNLVARFGQQAADAIWRRQLWQGATAEMVMEMHGPPHARDERVLKTKTVHVLKYWPRPHGSFGLTVTLENGTVVGWDTKA